MFLTILEKISDCIMFCFDVFHDMLSVDDGNIVYNLIIWIFLIMTFIRFVILPFMGRRLNDGSSDSVKKTPRNNQKTKDGD